MSKLIDSAIGVGIIVIFCLWMFVLLRKKFPVINEWVTKLEPKPLPTAQDDYVQQLHPEKRQIM